MRKIKIPHVWRLRSHLAGMLVVTTLLTFALVGGAILAYRIPQIESENLLAQQRDVGEMRARVELLLRARQSRLELLESLLGEATVQRANTVLDDGVRDSSLFHVAYRLSAKGQVVAAGLPQDMRAQRGDLLGNDLSANSLFREVSNGPDVAWDGKYPSVLTGAATLGVALRDGRGDVLIAELPLSSLLTVAKVAAATRSPSIWVVDRSGEIVADADHGREVGKLNIRNWPLMQSLLGGRDADQGFHYQGSDFHATVSHSPALGWYFVGRTPAGLANHDVRGLVLSVAASFTGCLVIGLLIAPFWASSIARPLQQIVKRAAQTTGDQGHDGAAWPRGRVAEFNQLSGDLETMTATLQEREQKAQEIFNAAPVPMAVADVSDDYRLLDVNHAWCREFGHRREDVLGRSTLEIDLWVDTHARVALRHRAENDVAIGNVWLRRSDGSTLLAHMHARLAKFQNKKLMIWATVDLSPLRRVELELQELNQQLEARVAQRTEALASSNEALLLTVEQLRAAQADLVRSEKMAALGALVAGVAHELNTPLGNSVMSVSTMAGAVHQFKTAMRGELRRTDLQQLVESVEQGTDIAARNLHRAADLVQNFKQVAVDQTSAQRRAFELIDVVNDMVVSLRPTFSRTPYRIDIALPATGLHLDSYPGALGQAIGNLIQNAVLHGFDGRAHGTVRISGERAPDGHILLRVADDGKGIPAALIERVFDPFMTTRMGRGGSGLGLHISYNAVVNLLGGTLTAQSTEGEGACFEMRLPSVAPRHAAPPLAASDASES